MGKEIKDGGPAFPRNYSATSTRATNADGNNGMALRDYFAAKAIQGMCYQHDTWGLTVHELAFEAYRIADALLEKREEET